MPCYVKKALCRLIKGSHKAYTSHCTSTYMCEYKHNRRNPKWKALGMLNSFICQEIMSVVNDH